MTPRSDLRVGANPGASLCGSSSATAISDNQTGPSNNPQAGNKVVPLVTKNGLRNGNFKVDYCNIRGLNTNINSVHQHLQTNKPHLLALGETKVSSSTSIVNYLYPGYEFHSRLRSNFGICLFARSDLSCQREEALEPKDFDVMWFKITTQQITRFICCLYRPPSDKQFRALFSSLANTVDFLQTNNPKAEIVILGDFNVHNID